MRAGFYLPSVILFLACLTANLDGGDKAPFLVLIALGLIALMLAISLIAAFFWKKKRSSSLVFACGCVLALGYTALILVLAKKGIVNPIYFLGVK